jgi:hypothetical protein
MDSRCPLIEPLNRLTHKSSEPLPCEEGVPECLLTGSLDRSHLAGLVERGHNILVEPVETDKVPP